MLPLRPPAATRPRARAGRAGGQQQVGERRRERCGGSGAQGSGAEGSSAEGAGSGAAPPLPRSHLGPPAPAALGPPPPGPRRSAPVAVSFRAAPVREGRQHPWAGSPAGSQIQQGFSHRDFFVFLPSNIRTHIETINTMKSTKYFISVVTVYFLYSEEISSFERCTEAATSALDAALSVKTTLLQLNLKTVIKKS